MHATTICHQCLPGHLHGVKYIALQQHWSGGGAAGLRNGGGERRKKAGLRTISAARLSCWSHMDHSTPSPTAPVRRRHEDNRSFGEVASSIGLATFLSKALGLFRETLLAAVYGVGPVMTAFSYSSILPGFFMAILGGINGPLQITMLNFISKCEENEGRVLLEKVSTAIFLICGGLSVVMFLCSSAIIDATAPGLLILPDGLNIRDLTILQLQIMAPCTLLAGLIGVGFGALSAAGRYTIVSLSPILSNICVILGVLVYTVFSKLYNASPTQGAVFLAFGVTAGALGQWIWQAKAQHELSLKFLPFRTIDPFNDKDLHKVFLVLVPAVLGSGMLQLATLTDMYFASFTPGAAAGLGYAYLLVMAPVGILSSSILLPMSSLFARVSKLSNMKELKKRISEGLLVTMATTLPVTAVGVSLSRPLVEVVLQRLAFDASASSLVSSLMQCYVAGSLFSLARELLTQVFYSLGDGNIPCYITMFALLVNALLDWQLIRIGPVGLVLATSFVNGLSVLAMLSLLSFRLEGLPFGAWGLSLLKMTGASILSGIVTKFIYTSSISAFPFIRILKLIKALSMSVASLMGIAVFTLVLYVFARDELQLLTQLLFSRFREYKENE